MPAWRSGWFSVALAATRPIIDKLNWVLVDFINRPETQDKMNALAITLPTSTSDELARLSRPRSRSGRRS